MNVCKVTDLFIFIVLLFYLFQIRFTVGHFIHIPMDVSPFYTTFVGWINFSVHFFFLSKTLLSISKCVKGNERDFTKNFTAMMKYATRIRSATALCYQILAQNKTKAATFDRNVTEFDFNETDWSDAEYIHVVVHFQPFFLTRCFF